MSNTAVIADYMVAFIAEYAKSHNLTDLQAFRYLWRYGAVAEIAGCYNAAHTLSFEDVCQTADRICTSRGGAL